LPCVKRPVGQAEIEGLVDEIEDALSRAGSDEVDSRLIGDLVMAGLKARDHVAYVRFASVYRNFRDIDEFAEELQDLSEGRAREALRKSQAELPL
ncbi:MAG: ATP cone domain-containing protein, partial [Gemmatimonadota bacterium]